MKKWTTLLLVAAMAVGVAACAPKTNAPGGNAPAANDPAPIQQQEPEPQAEEPAAEKPFSVGMVTDVGGVHDQSFNQSAWEGLQQLQTDYGVKVAYQESIQEANYGPNLDKMTDAGNDLIWGIGFMMADAILGAAQANPSQQYAIVDNAYDDTPDNITGVVFRAQEPSFLVGYLAALTTKTDKVGFVGGIQGVVIDQFEFGYRAGVAYGAKQAGKTVEVNVQYANSFSDDAAGKAIATMMYTNGADIVFHAAGGVGIGVINAAKEMNQLAIGVDRDQSYLAPDNVMSSAMKLVGQAMYDVSLRMKNGENVGGRTLAYGLAEGACGIPPYADSTAKLVDKAAYDGAKEAEKEIIAGTIDVPYNQETFDAYAAGL